MKRIIVKESQLINITENVIKEQFSDDPNTFRTKVEDVDLLGLKDYFPEYRDRDFEIVDMDCYVNWRYDLDVRTWGIKDISIYTTSVEVSAVIEIYDEEYTEVETTKEIELNVDDMGGFQSDEPDRWYYDDEKENEMRYHTIVPTLAQVDLEDKFITIFWN
tara:strand:- start:217 stop:699 length:483 start_codon:yes stop_codon:yes gene_type:complete